MIQSSEQMKKLAGIGLGLAAATVLLLAMALFVSGRNAGASQEAARANTALAQAVAALSVDPARAQGLAQSAGGSAGAATVIEQAQALQPIAEQVKARASALDSLKGGLGQIQAASSSLSQSRFLASGPWAQALEPLLSEASRPEVPALASVFASGRDTQSMMQWSGRFGQFTAEAARLNEIAARDRTMPAEEKQHIRMLSEGASVANEAMKSLVSLAGVSTQVVGATAMAAPVLANPPSPPPSSLAPAMLMAALVTCLAALGCLVMLFLVARQAMMHANAIISSSRQSSRNMQATARLLDNIHSLMPSGGAVYLDEHLVEPVESPMFGVASAFNRLIDVAATNRDKARDLQLAHDQRNREFNQALAGISASVQALASMVSDLSTRLLSQARTVAGLSEEAKRQASTSSHHAEAARNSSSSLQSAILRLEATRSTNQESSKRIKRMGESSQAIELASNRLQSMHQQIRVVAANIATAGAARGADGRDFMVLADQVQRLVQAGVEVSQDISQIIDLMKSDASDVTSGMERTTADHVDGGRALEAASGLLLEIERGLPEVSGNASRFMSELEDHALALSDVATQLSSVRSTIEKSSQSLSGLGQAGALPAMDNSDIPV